MNLDFKGYNGFALRVGDISQEAGKLYYYCLCNDLKCARIPKNQKCPDDLVPSGSVEWCLEILGKDIVPDYYPEWLSPHLHRKVWKSAKWPFEKVFIKPADRYKRFTGFVTNGGYKGKKKAPYWCSEIRHFVNEWRYYISNGKVLCGEWYYGDDQNTPEAPELLIEIPEGYCGCLDFGSLIDGKLALVEAQHPFACGWYGKQDELYFQWLIDGWKYMKETT